MYIRIISFVAILLSFFFAPWWVVFLCVSAYIISFKEGLESLLFGLCADVIYGTTYIYTLSCIGLYALNYFVQSRLRL